MAGVKIVLLSPDGLWSRLPFRGSAGRSAPAISVEEQAIVVIPVPQLVPELLSEKGAPRNRPFRSWCWAMWTTAAVPKEAADQSESRAAIRQGVRRYFRPLEETDDEINKVKRVFEKRFPPATWTCWRRPTPPNGSSASSPCRTQWLHLATHGFFAAPPTSAPCGSLESCSTEERTGPISSRAALGTGDGRCRTPPSNPIRTMAF